MLENLFHYVWKHKLFPIQTLLTDDGQTVEVIDTGLHNLDAGPDFFNAKIRLDDQLWVGNVELHLYSSDWYNHGHNNDPAYDNVILHVVTVKDTDYIRNSHNDLIPQLVIQIPEYLKQNYEQLLREDKYPRCYKIIPDIPSISVHSWMQALEVERLARKTVDVQNRLQQSHCSWEETYFQTLARNFGFGVNSDAFELWARNIPLNSIAHHRDDLFQIEALFLGQAGLLDINTVPLRHKDAMDADLYFHRLANEYAFLSHKFNLHPIERRNWKFLRLRPQNFPYVRLSQLASLYFNHQAGFSQILECKALDDYYKTFQVEVSEYWQKHYIFGEESVKNEKKLSKSSIDIILINTVAPILYSYGKQQLKEVYADRAFNLLETLKPENNNIVRLWQECGLSVQTAGDSQALIQLKKEYCDKKDCLRCRIGYYYMKKKNG